MSRYMICVSLVTAGLLAGTSLGQGPATEPATATQPAAAKQLLQNILSLMDMGQVQSPEELVAQVNQRMPQVLKAVTEMETKYPDSQELYEARLLGLVAATRLMRVNRDPVMAAVAEGLAKKVLASAAPPANKLYADAHLVLLELKPVGPAATQPVKDGPATVRQFVQRHDKAELGGEAYGVGMQLAAVLQDRALHEELRDAFVKKYPEHPAARQILRQQGRSFDVGKPFKAELTKLDGSKLTLPDDLPGKVVVVDFWATWCGPCVATVPRMRQLYATYKPQGVEFVGISLDDDKKTVAEFINAQGMGWIHTFSGKKWQDPTAQRYGIGAIPSIWVVGRDGKVVSDDAGQSLSATIQRALAAPAPTTTKAGGTK